MQTPTALIEASQFLANVDADWRTLITLVGPCTLTFHQEREPYEALVRTVAYQQLHAKAGDAIIHRLLMLYEGVFPTPAQLIDTPIEALRACGFSGSKISALYAIADGTRKALVPTRSQADMMTDEAIISQLVHLKGVGRWTAEMLLIFTLGRMDILPTNDFGVAAGYQRLKKLNTPPTPKMLNTLGLAWHPYRTVASWYLWRVPKSHSDAAII